MTIGRDIQTFCCATYRDTNRREHGELCPTVYPELKPKRPPAQPVGAMPSGYTCSRCAEWVTEAGHTCKNPQRVKPKPQTYCGICGSQEVCEHDRRAAEMLRQAELRAGATRAASDAIRTSWRILGTQPYARNIAARIFNMNRVRFLTGQEAADALEEATQSVEAYAESQTLVLKQQLAEILLVVNQLPHATRPTCTEFADIPNAIRDLQESYRDRARAEKRLEFELAEARQAVKGRHGCMDCECPCSDCRECGL